MAEIDSTSGLLKGVCQTFTAQQWRKTKCKLCFHDIMDHTKLLSKEESEEFIKTCMKESEDKDGGEEDEEREDLKNDNRSSGIFGDHSYSSQSNYTQGSSKGSSDRLDVEEEGGKDSDNDDGDETDSTHTLIGRRKRKGKLFHSLEKQDSIDVEDDGISTPNKSFQKRRTRSYRKNSSNLLQLSAMVRSSNSSLCSYTSELTDGFSDYDYDVRSITDVTDDTDDYAEINDVIDELELLKPELKVRVQNERRISRTKIFDLERELEGQQDFYRASEIAKDRQIKSLQREIEGLKLELSSVKAHENILALKSRLESEGKITRIQDLEQQVEALRTENMELSSSPISTQGREDALSRELKNAYKRIQHLEEENRATEERLKLAEDLQKNDRELLEVLRKQLSSIDDELIAAQDSNRLLEDKLKLMEMIRTDFLKEQDKCGKLTKETEALRQKIKRRDRHIEDLEDDNVKLHQLKTELESQLSKKEFKVKRMERKVSELKNEVIKCNKEIADLTGENKTLEQVRRLTDLQIKDLTQKETKTEVQNGEQIFIHTLEDRLKHNESRVKELELENDNFLKQIHEIYESLINAEKQAEEYKEQMKDVEAKCNKLRQESKHSDKKIELLQRKLLKSEKEKKRAVNRQNSAEQKLAQYEENDIAQPTSNVGGDDGDDKTSRMFRLKLQSTEAKLSVIEVNKGHLEAKVLSLERKLHDKEQEIRRLHDSMETDSGAPSQDYDRFDWLERENTMLQTKLDTFMHENTEQKESLNQLKENNAYLEMTIKKLNERLDVCTQRLKEVEEANHKLGREALRRTQSITSTQGEVDASINELRTHNKLLQEKVKQFDNVEELVERLEIEVKKEQAHAHWYFDENENLKMKIAKMADTIEALEESKKEFERSIRVLSDENKELNNDVKRLEEKLEIYGHLFGKDSDLYASLKRRSVQSDRDEEKIIENALSPLMEEIKEKDAQIRSLQKIVDEKTVTITALNEEIDLLESNLAAMLGEKIKHRTSDHSANESDNPETMLSFEKYRKGNNTLRKETMEENRVRTNEHPPSQRTFPSIRLQIKVDDGAVSSCELASNPTSSNDLTLSRENFYSMLHDHEELLKQKDIEYYRSLIESDEMESPTHKSFYQTIEKALLDQYKDDENTPSFDVKVTSDGAPDSLNDEIKNSIEKPDPPMRNNSDIVSTELPLLESCEPIGTVRCSNSESSIDLSGLDDLLAEVNKRNSGGSLDQPTPVYKERDIKLTPLKPIVVPKTVMPSIRTTKRRIIKLGGLNRSDSFDSATSRKANSISQSYCSISSRSSSHIPPTTLKSAESASHSLISSSSTSSLASSASMTSVIYVPSEERSSPLSGKHSSTENVHSAPFKRPTLDANKFLNSSSSNIE